MIKKKKILIFGIFLVIGNIFLPLCLGQPVYRRNEGCIGGGGIHEKLLDNTSETWGLFAVVDMTLSVIPYYSEISAYNLPTSDGVYGGILILNLEWSNAVSDITCFQVLLQETHIYHNNTSGGFLMFAGLLAIKTTLGAIEYTFAGGVFGIHISPEQLPLISGRGQGIR